MSMLCSIGMKIHEIATDQKRNWSTILRIGLAIMSVEASQWDSSNCLYAY